VIISLKYNFIYIRTRKTASTSIHRALEQVLGPDDVCIRGNNYDLSSVLRKGAVVPEDGFQTHVAAAEIRPYLLKRMWNRAFRFTSERHPYEKAVSLAFYYASKSEKVANRGRKAPSEDFGEVLQRVVKAGHYAGFPLYYIGDAPVVSDFIRYESLEADLNRIAQKLGFELPPLPEMKTAVRKDRRPARDILTKAQRETIYRMCRREFELLGYEP
jgi:hypothetical protein